jgi:hypothetical protein
VEIFSSSVIRGAVSRIFMFPPCGDRFRQFRSIGSGVSEEFMAATRAAQRRSGAWDKRR